jgi:tetratricopeptide (TPR) repeat protein
MAYVESLIMLSEILIRQHKYDTAEGILWQAIDALEEPLSTERLWTKVRCQHMLAIILAQHHGKLGDAEQILRRILLDPDDMGNKIEFRIETELDLAQVLMKQNRNREAEQVLRQLLESCENPFGMVHAEISRDLGRVLRKQGKLAEAEAVALQASNIVLVHGPADIRSQYALLALGNVRLAQRAHGEAASVLRQACDAISTPYHHSHLECLQAMGYALRHLQRYDEGVSFYARAFDGYAQILGTDHESTRKCAKGLDKCRALLARRAKTEEQRERARTRGTDHREEASAGCTGCTSS